MNIQLEEILNRVHTTDNRVAIQAVDELRELGWLTDGSLHGIGLCKANLQGANLANANLCCVGLHQADLEWSNLSGAQLQAAKLSLCNLSSSNLKNANLDSTDFFKVNLHGVQNLTDEQLLKASRLCGATMPDGERYDGRFSLFGDLSLAKWNNFDTSDFEAMAEFYGIPVDVYTQGQLELVQA